LDDPKEVEGSILDDRPYEVKFISEYDFLWFAPFFLFGTLGGVFEAGTLTFCLNWDFVSSC
jgi:hypothetical protein